MCCFCAFSALSRVTTKTRVPAALNDGCAATSAFRFVVVDSEKFGQNRSTSGLPAMASARISMTLPSREGRTHEGAMSPAPRTADIPPCWESLALGVGLATCFIRRSSYLRTAVQRHQGQVIAGRRDRADGTIGWWTVNRGAIVARVRVTQRGSTCRQPAAGGRWRERARHREARRWPPAATWRSAGRTRKPGRTGAADQRSDCAPRRRPPAAAGRGRVLCRVARSAHRRGAGGHCPQGQGRAADDVSCVPGGVVVGRPINGGLPDNSAVTRNGRSSPIAAHACCEGRIGESA